MNTEQKLIVFEKTSEKKQNELLKKKLWENNILPEKVKTILSNLNLDKSLYDALAEKWISNVITTKLSTEQKLKLRNELNEILDSNNPIKEKAKNQSENDFDSLLLANPNNKILKEVELYLNSKIGTENPIPWGERIKVNKDTKYVIRELFKNISIDNDDNIMIFNQSLKLAKQDRETDRHRYGSGITVYNIHGVSYNYEQIEESPIKALEIFRKTPLVAKVAELWKEITWDDAITNILDLSNPIQHNTWEIKAKKEFLDIFYLLGIRDNIIILYTNWQFVAYMNLSNTWNYLSQGRVILES